MEHNSFILNRNHTTSSARLLARNSDVSAHESTPSRGHADRGGGREVKSDEGEGYHLMEGEALGPTSPPQEKDATDAQIDGGSVLGDMMTPRPTEEA